MTEPTITLTQAHDHVQLLLTHTDEKIKVKSATLELALIALGAAERIRARVINAQTKSGRIAWGSVTQAEKALEDFMEKHQEGIDVVIFFQINREEGGPDMKSYANKISRSS